MIRISVSGFGEIEAREGEKLYELLSCRGLTEGPCGGKGRCGKCRVRLLTPCPPEDEEYRFFTKEEIEAGWRLACLHTAEDGMAVALPEREETPEPLTAGAEAAFTPDAEEGFGVAVDIGTTTVAACLVDRRTGKQLAKAACLNSQRAFGQDVITRIDYSNQNADGLKRMQEAVCADLRTLGEKLCHDAGLDPGEISAWTVAANNVMTHIFTGADPAGLAAYPFTPAYTGARDLSAAELGLPGAAGARVWCLPAVSAYVGGDITAGMLTCDLAAMPGNNLLIDIGTNGEMVLSRGGTMFSCSCAAGPALEGMDIRCGMRAAAGAIEDAQIVWRDGVPHWLNRTIGGAPACGLCGSGLLAAVTELVEAGAIGENGRLQLHPLVTAVEGKRRVVLDAEKDIYLSQADIRQVQLAKGAILAGVEILLKEAGLSPDQMDKVLVAGQFGAHLTPRSLVGSGLLPGSLADKIAYVGNTSLAGAVACLLSGRMREKSLHQAENVHYLELSAYPGYEKDLMRAMRFAPAPLPRFTCIGDHRVRRVESADGDEAAWHFSAETLAAEARRQGAAGWRILPFCTTLIAESLGARPFLDAEGARVSETPYQKADQLPAGPDFALPRVRALEGAMALLKGEDLIWQLDGPLTVLGQLIPMGRLFVALRKSDELLTLAEDWICRWADWAVVRGVKVLSFADPIATLDLLGEKTYRSVYLPALRHLLDRLRREHPDTVLYVCGKMTQSLLDSDAVVSRIRRFDADNYGEALRSFCRCPEDAMVGHFCAHLLSSPETALTLFTWKA